MSIHARLLRFFPALGASEDFANGGDLDHARMRAPRGLSFRSSNASHVGKRLKRPSDLGDPLREFSATVSLGRREPSQGGPSALRAAGRGRPPLDAAAAFKILVIQAAKSDRRANSLPD